MTPECLLRAWRLALVAAWLVGAVLGQERANAAEDPDPRPGAERKASDLEPPLPAGAVARLGSSRLTHEGEIGYLQIRRDQRTVLSMGDNTWRIWDAENGKELFRRSEVWLRAVALAPDESALAVVTVNSIKWYDPSTRKLLRTWEIENVIGVAFSPDSKQLAVCLESGEVLLHDVASGKKQRRLPERTVESAKCIAFAPDGDKLATAGNGGVIRLWDLRSGEEVARLKGPEEWTEFVRFSPSGDSLYYRGFTSQIHRYALKSRDIAKEVAGLGDCTCGIDFSADGKLVAVGCNDRIEIRDMKSSAIVAALPHSYRNKPSCIRFSPDGRLVLTGLTIEHGIHIWDVARHRERIVVPRIVPIISDAFTQDDRSLAIDSLSVQ